MGSEMCIRDRNYTIVPVLFLKNAPKDDAGNAMLSENVVELMK